MVEAMVALTLADHVMMQHAQCELFPNDMALEDQPNPMGTTATRGGWSPEHAATAIVGDDASVQRQRIDEE